MKRVESVGFVLEEGADERIGHDDETIFEIQDEPFSNVKQAYGEE